MVSCYLDIFWEQKLLGFDTIRGRKKKVADMIVDNNTGKRPSVFEDAGGKMGVSILPADIEAIKSKEGSDKADIDGLKSLLQAKALMTEESFNKVGVLSALTPESSYEEVEAAVNKVKAIYDEKQKVLMAAEMEVLNKMSLCGAFTVYCCLCTACASCCIGPYFTAQYLEELTELTDSEKWSADLNNAYQQIN